MTSERNVSSNDKYLSFQNDEQSNSGPKRVPTEGEIDQFIELLKNSNTGNTSSLEGDKPIFSGSTSTYWKPNSVCNVSPSELNSRVTLKEDGTLMKTIHVQSPDSYLREAERFDPEMHHERDSFSPISESSDYLRKATYLNKQSELKVTLSRDHDRSYGYHDRYMDREMSYREDERHYTKDFKPSESHSRSYGYIHERERSSYEYGSSSSNSRYSGGPVSRDVDMRRLPSISQPLNSPRSSYAEEYRPVRDRSPPRSYSDRTSMRIKNSPPYRSGYHGAGGGISYSRDIPRSYSKSQRFSISPSPPRSSRIRRSSRENQLYSPDDRLSDYDIYRTSPDVQFNSGDKRYEIPSPPSPPPPPVLSDLKKKKKEGMDRGNKKMVDKDTVNPISTLLADRNVSISTLLEAAIGSSIGCWRSITSGFYLIGI